MAGLQDNTTLDLKVTLRRNLLRHIADPVICETHGGYGRVWLRCYHEVATGIVIEKNPDKAESLAAQRPTWLVAEADCVKALAAGLGSHLAINILDIDPYGSPWDVIAAFFGSERPWPATLGIAVNDGLRHKLEVHGGWEVEALEGVTRRYGNAYLYSHYLAICEELLAQHVAKRGYAITEWAGYYCGRNGHMTHYAAVLRREDV